jgi:hypothetical protein
MVDVHILWKHSSVFERDLNCETNFPRRSKFCVNFPINIAFMRRKTQNGTAVFLGIVTKNNYTKNRLKIF